MVVGLTGGIGSGKTTVARIFKSLGIAIYIADDHAKRLMVEDLHLKESIQSVLGAQAYQEGLLNKKYIASQIFGNSEKLKQINDLVHPAVAKDFGQWRKQQSSPYVIKEAAILFENGSYRLNDFNLMVVASVEERIRRVIARDKTTEAEVRRRMNTQWDDTKKIALADAHIVNDTLANTEKKVLLIHQHLLKRIRQNW
jgi:dephospho-CoA kinase